MRKNVLRALLGALGVACSEPRPADVFSTAGAGGGGKEQADGGGPITTGGIGGSVSGGGTSTLGGSAPARGGAFGGSSLASGGVSVSDAGNESGGNAAGRGGSGGVALAAPRGGAIGEGGNAGSSMKIGAFVAVGYGGRRIRSIDAGMSWIDEQVLRLNGGDDDSLLRAVGYGAGRFVAAGDRIFTSIDGKDWVEGTNTTNQWIGGIAFGNSMWVMAGGYGMRQVSVDAMSWQRVNDGVITAFRALTFDHGNGRFIASGDGQLRMSSADGTQWETGAGSITADDYGSAAAGGGSAMILGERNATLSKDGGLTWGASHAFAVEVSGVARAEDGFIVVGPGHAYRLPDGGDWMDVAVTGLAGKVACFASLCVCVAERQAFRSLDAGRTWTPTQSFPAGSQALLAITSGEIL